MKAIIQETSKRNSSYRNVHYMWQMEKCMQICLIKKKKGFRNNSTKVTGFWFLWFGMSEKFSLNLQKSI